MADPEIWKALIESGNPYAQQERQQKGLMGMMLLQEKQREMEDTQKLRDLYSSGHPVSPNQVMAINPKLGIDLQQAGNQAYLQQLQAEDMMRKKDEYESKVYAQHMAPVAQAYHDAIKSGTDPKVAESQFRWAVGDAQKNIHEQFGIIPRADFTKFSPQEIATRAHMLGVDVPWIKEIQDEEQSRRLIQQKQEPNFAEKFGTVTRNPLTNEPEQLPPVSMPQTSVPIIEFEGKRYSGPEFAKAFMEEKNPKRRQAMNDYIDASMKSTQQGIPNATLPMARGTTAAEKGEIAGAEAKAKKIAEAEASRETQHEKMTAAFDYQHLKDLINKSTPGGVSEYGTMATQAATLSTPWSRADTQLGIDAAALLQAVPRFEGPQSDADRASYEKAAGNLAKPNIPRGDRIAALDEMKRLLDKYEIKYGKESNLDEAVIGRRKAALDMLNKGQIDEAQFKTMWDQK